VTTELTLLGWALVLAIVQVLVAAAFRNRETGIDYNAGARDAPSPAPVGRITGRLQRAQRNLYETLPLFAAAILIANVAGREGNLTLWGAWLYVVARVVYVPLYAAGVPVVRSLVWGVSLFGVVLVLIAVLGPG
jgi:uncharacterized MAPEG superfamily protein